MELIINRMGQLFVNKRIDSDPKGEYLSKGLQVGILRRIF